MALNLATAPAAADTITQNSTVIPEATSNLIQGDNPLYIAVASDGKNLKQVDGMEWIKIPEKREGKGKGKTIAAISVPVLEYDAGILSGILNQAVNELRRELIVSMYRAGNTNLTADDIGEQVITKFWSEKSFSAETVGSWFDNEMSVVLMIAICAAKGWQEDQLDAAQGKYVEQKLAAYRASYLECTSKFPKLNPTQMAELVRIIKLGELSGPIVDRIMEKIKPQVSGDQLGF